MFFRETSRNGRPAARLSVTLAYMKIIIDCRMINRSGIGTVIQELVPRLIDAPHEFVLLGDPACLAGYANDRAEIVSFQQPVYSLREQIRFPRRVLCEDSVLLCPHYNMLLSTFPRLVVIVHDLAHLVLPRYFSGIAKRMYVHFFLRVVLRRAFRIVTPSEFTRTEILRRLQIHPNKVITIPNGPGRSFPQPVDLSADRLTRYHVRFPYLLAVGNVKPHKNFEFLLRAFTLIKPFADPELELVIAGKTFTKDSSFASVQDRSRERWSEEGVVLTGHVSDEDMPALYHNAALYVAPSLYEGFGLTPLEAVRFGTLPLVADAAALAELVDDPDLRFDPREPEDLARKMLIFLNEPELAKRKLSEQEKTMAGYSWDAAANGYLGLLEEAGAATGKKPA